MNLEKTYELYSHGSSSEVTLKEVLNKSPKTLLYFYPKDNTPGCTLEAQDFTRNKKHFESLWIQIVGVSKDSSVSHGRFTESCGLSIDLISDQDTTLHNEFSVIGEKNMYGKITVGVIRSTFLLDSNGNILKEWRNVKATWHAEKILKQLQENK